MNWDDLKVFLYIARTGGIGDAAKLLQVDHSTVSRRLLRLEEKIGAKLFDRAGRRLKITPAGQTLMGIAGRLESIVLSEAEAFSGQPEDVAGKVRIGAPEALGIAYLGKRLSNLATGHRNLELELVALPQNYSLASREVDIAITLDRPEVGSVSTRRLTSYRLGLFAAAAYIRRNGAPQSLPDLGVHTFCGYIPELLFTRELNYIELMGFGLSSKLRSTSVFAQREIVESGAAIAVLPLFMTTDRPDLVPVLSSEFAITRNYWMSVHQDLKRIARIRHVIEEIARMVRRDQNVFMPRA